MKNKLLILALITLLSACEKTQFDDPTTYTIDEAIEITPDYYFKLASGNFVNALFSSNDGYSWGFGMSALADQTTVTNRVNEWWDFAKEPRIAMNNSQSYAGAGHFSGPYDVFYKVNLNANIILEGFANGGTGIDDAGVDRTAEVTAVAYLLKGMALGNIGAIYDRGLIANENLAANGALELPNSYKEMIEASIGFFDQAIAAANSAPSITLSDFYINVNLDKAGFIRFANSLAARTLASVPRDKSEAQALGASFWNRVLTYANAGFTTDFTTAYVNGGFYNYNVEYGLVDAGGGPYLPADIKVAYLADNTGNYPNSYPLDESVILSPVQTDDDRFATYFKYGTAFGYLRTDRGRNLFSNYKHNRWSVPGSFPNTVGVTGYLSPVFLAEEVRLLRAEAKMFSGDLAGAAAELNDPSADRILKGGLGSIGATEEEIRKTLHYEYAISIDLAGGSINPWVFMRRNDLLQKGTPTEFPVPEQQLLLTGDEIYTFGGQETAGAKGVHGEVTSASGVGAWKQ